MDNLSYNYSNIESNSVDGKVCSEHTVKNSTFSTFHSPPFTFHSQLSIHDAPLRFGQYFQLSTLHSPPFTFHSPLSTFHSPLSSLHFFDQLGQLIGDQQEMIGIETRRKEGQPKSYYTPYDYGIFNGKRCASSAFDMLVKNCVIPDAGYLRLLIEINPGNVYRYLMILASVNSWGWETSYDEQMKFQPFEGKSVEKFLGKTKKYNSYKKNIVDKLIKRWYAKKEDE